MSRRWRWAPVAAALLVAGCSTAQPGDLSANAENQLKPQVQHVREVAAEHDYLRLQAAIDELKSMVERLRAQGDVSSDRATAIEDAADALLTDASPSPSPTPSPTTTSPTPSPTTTSPTPSPTTTSPTPSPTPTSPTPTPSPTTTSPGPLISVG